MASIPLSEVAFKSVKKAAQAVLPSVPSAHLTEAIAFAAGKNTHASLLAAVKASGEPPFFVLLNEARFAQRLREFGYETPKLFSFEKLKADQLISTGTPAKKRSQRWHAWRNLMIVGINEGLRRGYFGLIADDNRCPNAQPPERESFVFDFALPNALPARCFVDDIAFGELAVHVAVNPKEDMLCAFNAGFSAGDALATGWLERAKGAWLQDSGPTLTCRNTLLEYLANLDIAPLGYGDNGKFFL